MYMYVRLRALISGAPALLAAAALAAGIAVRPVLKRMMAKLRIHRLRVHLSALSSHAATARAFSHEYRKLLEGTDEEHEAAESVRERLLALSKLQRRALAGLEATRARVDDHLLDLLRSPYLLEANQEIGSGGGRAKGSNDAAVAAIEARVRADLGKETELAVQILGQAVTASVVPTAPPSRELLLRQEQEALHELEAGGKHVNPLPVQPRALRRAVHALRTEESSLEFQAQLLAEQLRLARTSGYTGENFAYGSTPLQSWLALFRSAPVQAVLRAAASPGDVRYVVLGSSLGSLVMYGACVYGLPSRGIELMPALAERSQRIAREAGVENVSFECADMLHCDLSGSSMVLLASQCWDRSLLHAVRAKLLAELMPGALVLDYTSALGETKDPSTTPKSTSGRNHFALLTTVSAPVSWDGAHKFWVWRVIGRAL